MDTHPAPAVQRVVDTEALVALGDRELADQLVENVWAHCTLGSTSELLVAAAVERLRRAAGGPMTLSTMQCPHRADDFDPRCEVCAKTAPVAVVQEASHAA